MPLSKKDARFREFALNGNLWNLVFSVGIPLAIYNALHGTFNILDTFLASTVSTDSVSAVTYLNQYMSIFSQIGSGLAVGGSLLVSRAYGAGDYEKMKKNVSTLVAFSSILSIIVLAMIPFAGPILRVTGTPEPFIEQGTRYFAVSLFSIVISFFNSIYVSIDRARGKTRKILFLNSMIIVVKLILSRIFIRYIESDIIMISYASVIAQAMLLVYAIYYIFLRNDSFSFSFSSISFSKGIALPMLSISLPLMLEKTAFSLGKVIVNNMCAFYGPDTIGALGISNSLNGIYNNAQIGLQDGASSVISQNVGAGRYRRAVKAFWIVTLYNLVISVIGYAVIALLIVPISRLFSTDEVFSSMIVSINAYGSIGAFSLFLCSSSTAFLFGIGKTQLTLLINFCRVLFFRIPVLWFLINFTEIGYISSGIVMLVSNVLTSIVALLLALNEIRKLRKEDKLQES